MKITVIDNTTLEELASKVEAAVQWPLEIDDKGQSFFAILNNREAAWAFALGLRVAQWMREEGYTEK
jgi:hypothetical protein